MLVYFVSRVGSELMQEHLLKSHAFVLFSDYECEILLCGGLLMYIADYKQAITESVWVNYKWCIFYTIPVMAKWATIFLRKRAYEQPVIESILNEGKLYHLLEQKGLMVRDVLPSILYDLKDLLNEPTTTKNLCMQGQEA